MNVVAADVSRGGFLLVEAGVWTRVRSYEVQVVKGVPTLRSFFKQ